MIRNTDRPHEKPLPITVTGQSPQQSSMNLIQKQSLYLSQQPAVFPVHPQMERSSDQNLAGQYFRQPLMDFSQRSPEYLSQYSSQQPSEYLIQQPPYPVSQFSPEPPPQFSPEPLSQLLSEPPPQFPPEPLSQPLPEPPPQFMSDLPSLPQLESLPQFPPEPSPQPESLPQFPPEPPEQPSQPPPARAREPSVWRDLGVLILKCAAIIGIALLLFTFVYGLYYNIDSGMHPSLKDGDLVMFYRWDKNYRAGDLLLLNFQDQKQARRVVASAGDTVDISEEGLIINGALQQERDIYRKTQRYAEGIDFPLTLREDEVFVLGDAREGVTDSRIYGAVRNADTLGKVIAVLRRRNL